MTFGSLYSGVGGLDLGLERAGLRCLWQVEINGFARRVLARHWPDVPRHDDVRTFPPDDPGQWAVDMICGGDPCQGNSNAGSVHKVAREDLGTEFLRVVAAIRPRLVLRENPSRSRPDALWPWRRMRDGLGRLGYAVLPFRLRACCAGADHERERLFLLASLPDADGERPQGFDGEGLAVRDAGRAAGDRVRVGSPDRLPPPRICRGADRVPDRVERLVGLGNAVDPRVAELIGRRIVDAFGVETPIFAGDRP